MLVTLSLFETVEPMIVGYGMHWGIAYCLEAAIRPHNGPR